MVDMHPVKTGISSKMTMMAEWPTVKCRIIPLSIAAGKGRARAGKGRSSRLTMRGRAAAAPSIRWYGKSMRFKEACPNPDWERKNRKMEWPARLEKGPICRTGLLLFYFRESAKAGAECQVLLHLTKTIRQGNRI
jgi:hypothetical protein